MAPSAPTGLVATSTAANRITVTWTNQAEYNLVELWYKTAVSAWHAFPEFSGTTESYIDGVGENDVMT